MQRQHDDTILAGVVSEAVIGDGVANRYRLQYRTTEQVAVAHGNRSFLRRVSTRRARRGSRIDGQRQHDDAVAARHIGQGVLILIRATRCRQARQALATEQVRLTLCDRGGQRRQVCMTDGQPQLHDGVTRHDACQRVVVRARGRQRLTTEQVRHRLAERRRYHLAHSCAHRHRYQQQQQGDYSC